MLKFDLKALLHNTNLIKSIAPVSKILAVVKDNAYGHGLIQVVQTLVDHVDAFGVISMLEAIAIRKAGIDKPIVLMQGISQPSDLKICIENDITIVLHNYDQLVTLSKCNYMKKLKIWIKLNCGLNRLGFPASSIENVLKEVKRIKIIDGENICIMSHLSSASNPIINEVSSECDTFRKYTDHLSFPRSLASSAGILKYPNTHFEWVRPGLLLYGISPFHGQTGQKLGFKPVMTLEAEIIAIQRCQVGEGIGYDKSWKCKYPSIIAIANAGYADGYPFHIIQGTPALIKEKTLPIVGKVSSDAIAIDVTSISNNVTIGDKVTLWGDGLPVEIIAEYSNTISDQLLCGVAQRCINFNE